MVAGVESMEALNPCQGDPYHQELVLIQLDLSVPEQALDTALAVTLQVQELPIRTRIKDRAALDKDLKDLAQDQELELELGPEHRK